MSKHENVICTLLKHGHAKNESFWIVRVCVCWDTIVLIFMLRKETMVFQLMGSWIQAKHVFFRKTSTQTKSVTSCHTNRQRSGTPWLYVFLIREYAFLTFMNIPFVLNRFAVCLPSPFVYIRMWMMSDFTIAAVCHMRAITSECETSLCLWPAAHLLTFCCGLH